MSTDKVREALAKIREYIEGNSVYGRPHILEDFLPIVEEAAAREALSAQPAEPVAWRYHSPSTWRLASKPALQAYTDILPGFEQEPLFATQPAPSVPDLPDPNQLESWRTAADELLRNPQHMPTIRSAAFQLQNAYLFARKLAALASQAEKHAAELAKLRQGEPVAGWRLLKDTTYAERSWPEDASHENGCYSNTCCHCGRAFTGHKRRPSCKACSAASTPPVQPLREALQPLSDADFLRCADENFPDWRVDIQERFVTELGHAIERLITERMSAAKETK
jgi:hypothetical protein